MKCIKGSKLIKKAIYLLCMFLLFSIITGCNNESKKDKSEDKAIEKTSKETKQAEEKTLFQLNEKGVTENLEIEVTNVVRATQWTKTPTEDREYVVIAIKVTNISNEEQSISVSDFQYVSDENGNREAYEAYSGVETNPDTFGAATLTSGETFEGSIVYLMPKALSRIELHYIEGYSINPTLAFELSK